MGKSELPVGTGLHIVPCRSIHTFFMRLPIDVLFLSPDQTVLKVYHALPPWRATPVQRGARSVLELPARTIGASQTREGDRLQFEPGDTF